MPLNAFAPLIGLRLAIVRRAADMLVLHFGDVRVLPAGAGSIGAYALHIQCPWRFDGPHGTVTGRDDLWDYAGPGKRPPRWSHEDGLSLQDQKWSRLFDRDEDTRSWVNTSDRFVVTGTEQTERGDIKLEFSNGSAILVFPAATRSEAWRFFVPGGDSDHLIFPNTTADSGGDFTA